MSEKIYISGALTNIFNPESVKTEYERIEQFCQELGFDAYLPHRHTDPEKNPDVSPTRIFEIDKHHVSTSDRMITFVTIPSLGVGLEIGFALAHDVQIILMRKRSHPLSKIISGCPGAIEVCYNDLEDAFRQLTVILKEPHMRGQKSNESGQGSLEPRPFFDSDASGQHCCSLV